MKELVKSSNPVRISFLCALLDDAGIAYSVFDNQMASIFGTAFGARLMVEEEDIEPARRLMALAEKDIDLG